jgi:putative SOS response-associated peptidase YedK
MCVRYTLHKSDAALGAISRALGRPLDNPDWAGPRYNVTLTDTMPVVAVSGGETRVRPMRWGFVPASDRGLARPKLIANARSETAESLPLFRKAVSARRCLVPANGFYEWQTLGSQKIPHFFALEGEESFAFAGLWDPEGGGLPETYCILTTVPNELVGSVHDRMPVILSAEGMARWLGEGPLAPGEYPSLVKPFPAARMTSRPVNRYVSNSRNQGPKCLEPPEESPREPEFDFG